MKDGIIKLSDFGLCTSDPLSDEFHTGSTRYMCPEVHSPEPEPKSLKMPYLTAANDVWALGIILINMLTSQNPWKQPSHLDKLYARFKNEGANYFKNQFGFSLELCKVLESVFCLIPSQDQLLKCWANS